MARREAFRLLNGGGLHQRPEVVVDHLLLFVDGLGKAMQKHRCHGYVLSSPSELWGIVPPVHGVALDPTGATPGAARRFMRTGQCGASSILAQLAARSAAVVVAPRRAPM